MLFLTVQKFRFWTGDPTLENIEFSGILTATSKLSREQIMSDKTINCCIWGNITVY